MTPLYPSIFIQLQFLSLNLNHSLRPYLKSFFSFPSLSPYLSPCFSSQSLSNCNLFSNFLFICPSLQYSLIDLPLSPSNLCEIPHLFFFSIINHFNVLLVCLCTHVISLSSLLIHLPLDRTSFTHCLVGGIELRELHDSRLECRARQ